MLDRTSTFDSFSAAGAQAMAWRIEDFWRGRGHPMIRAWTERQRIIRNDGRATPFYVIKSNIAGNGYPPGDG